MKHYFFRDLDNEANLYDGKTHHAAGLVYGIHCELNKPNPSGKDFAVSFFDPFEGYITREWRAVGDVELFEVNEWEYEHLENSYNAVEKSISRLFK